MNLSELIKDIDLENGTITYYNFFNGVVTICELSELAGSYSIFLIDYILDDLIELSDLNLLDDDIDVLEILSDCRLGRFVEFLEITNKLINENEKELAEWFILGLIS